VKVVKRRGNLLAARMAFLTRRGKRRERIAREQEEWKHHAALNQDKATAIELDRAVARFLQVRPRASA